jgi:Flp pilus assembly protein TadG
VDIKNQRNSGAMSLQMLVLLVPVMLGIMGFAVDLGRLYLIRGELTHAAEAMALAAASKLIGTDTGLSNATAAAQATLDDTSGHGNKYNFGSLVIGGSTSLLTSTVSDPVYFATAAGAIGEDTSSSDTGNAAGATAKYVQINLTADAPLLFWAILSLGQARKTPVAAMAVAGVSAPLCTACGIEPFALAAPNQADPTDFGFSPGVVYTFGFQCTGGTTPTALPEGTQRIPYLIIDRLNTASTFDETQQLYRIGAQGLLPAAPGSGTSSATPSTSFACIMATGTEIAWASAQPPACGSATVPTIPPSSVTQAMCGIYSRFATDVPTACEGLVTDIDTLAGAYQPDADLTDISDYSTYVGNARRVITVPIVDTLSPAGPMTVLGFRQFLVNPDQNGVNITPSDQDGRFNALYIGNPVPLKQGRFDGGCDLPSGPGKVVLHR